MRPCNVMWCKLWCVMCDVWRSARLLGTPGQCSLFTRILDSVTSQSPAGGARVTSGVMMTWWWHDHQCYVMTSQWYDHDDGVVTARLLLTSRSCLVVTSGWPLIVTSWRLLTNPGWCGLDRLPQRLQAGGPGPRLRARGQQDVRAAAGGGDGLPGLVFLSHRWLPLQDESDKEDKMSLRLV